MSPVSQLVESIIDMPGKFADVMLQGPVEAALVMFGGLFIVIPSVLLLYLTLGAGIDLVRSGPRGSTHPNE